MYKAFDFRCPTDLKIAHAVSRRGLLTTIYDLRSLPPERMRKRRREAALLPGRPYIHLLLSSPRRISVRRRGAAFRYHRLAVLRAGQSPDSRTLPRGYTSADARNLRVCCESEELGPKQKADVYLDEDRRLLVAATERGPLPRDPRFSRGSRSWRACSCLLLVLFSAATPAERVGYGTGDRFLVINFHDIRDAMEVDDEGCIPAEAAPRGQGGAF